jgi:flagellar hook capping protein FlgD
VFGQWDLILASGARANDGTRTLSFQASSAGTFLLDVYALGLDSGSAAGGAYSLTTTVTPNQPSVTLEMTAPACSPNGDAFGELCRWSIDERASSATSTITNKNGTTVRTISGDGDQQWDGDGQPDGAYNLRVVVNGAGGVSGRTVVVDDVLTLDRARPVISDFGASPNPFQPVPEDGDRDTTTFATTSNERALIRVYIYDASGLVLKKTLQASGFQPAGRISVVWDGVSGTGQQLPKGAYSFLIHVIDPAGNRVGTARYPLTIS